MKDKVLHDTLKSGTYEQSVEAAYQILDEMEDGENERQDRHPGRPLRAADAAGGVDCGGADDLEMRRNHLDAG